MFILIIYFILHFNEDMQTGIQNVKNVDVEFVTRIVYVVEFGSQNLWIDDNCHQHGWIGDNLFTWILIAID